MTPAQAARYWEGAGGPASRTVEWVAIGIGESSLETGAVSPAGAIGWLQIMPFNATAYGFAPNDMKQPDLCAWVALQMSGQGTNCAAWDSAYRNIYATGRYRFLGWPEQGSADYTNMAYVAAELGGRYLRGMTGPAAPGIDTSLNAAVNRLQQAGGHSIPQTTALARRGITVIGRMYR